MCSQVNFSYADPNDPILNQLTIRSIERLIGQPKLKRIYDRYVDNPKPGENFFSAAVRRFRLHTHHNPHQLGKVPRSDPLVVVANHPFGVVDGMTTGHLVSRVRSDYKIIAHGLLTRSRSGRSTSAISRKPWKPI